MKHWPRIIFALSVMVCAATAFTGTAHALEYDAWFDCDGRRISAEPTRFQDYGVEVYQGGLTHLIITDADSESVRFCRELEPGWSFAGFKELKTSERSNETVSSFELRGPAGVRRFISIEDGAEYLTTEDASGSLYIRTVIQPEEFGAEPAHTF